MASLLGTGPCQAGRAFYQLEFSLQNQSTAFKAPGASGEASIECFTIKSFLPQAAPLSL